MKFELQQASFDEKHLLRRMLELYLYDLSEYEQTDLNVHGEFGYRYLDLYWIEPERHPFFVKIDGKLGGFVLINRFGYTEGLEYSIGDFFIMKRYRRNGIGRTGALEAFGKFHGLWEIRTHGRNTAAKAF